MNYEKIEPDVTRAVQFDGESATDVRALGLQAVVIQPSPRAKKSLKISTEKQIMIVEAGTWVCTNANKQLFQMSDKDFTASYKELKPRRSKVEPKGRLGRPIQV